MPFDEGEKILRRVASESGLQKMRAAVRDVVRRRGAKIGKIAAATTRDEDLVSAAAVVLQHDNATSTQAGSAGAKQPCRPAADHDHVDFRR